MRGWSYDRQAHLSYQSGSPYSGHTHTLPLHLTTPPPLIFTSLHSFPSPLITTSTIHSSSPPAHIPLLYSPHWVPVAPSSGRASSCAPGWPGSAAVWSRCRGSSKRTGIHRPLDRSRRQRTWHSCVCGLGSGSSTHFWLEASACKSKRQTHYETLERSRTGQIF